MQPTIIRLTKEDRDALRDEARRVGTSTAAVVRRLIREYLRSA